MKKLTILLAWVIFALASNFAYTQDATEILNKHIEALGGYDNIKAIKSVKVKQTVTAQGYDIQQSLIILPGEGLRSETNAVGNVTIISVKGDSGWQINPAQYGNNTPVALSASMVKAIKGQADIFGPLIDFKEKGYKMELQGTEKVNDEEAYKLKVTIKENLDIVTFISKKSYMVLRTVVSGNETNFYDYYKVDGFMQPSSMEVISRNGKITIGERKIEINVKVDCE
jgi:hypothetical protein